MSTMNIPTPTQVKDPQHELEYFQYIFNLGLQKLQEKQKSQVKSQHPIQSIDNHSPLDIPNLTPQMSHQAPYPPKPIGYHPRMPPRDGNTYATAIPPLMGKKNLQQQNSPIIRPSGLPQQSQQQIKSPATSSSAARRRLNDSGEIHQPQQ
jgi:hypothetical protein